MNLLKVSKSINSPKLEYIENKKPLIRIELRVLKNISVVPLGLEPRLFYTKNRRVASYTMGHYLNADANLIQTLACTNIF